MIDFEKYWTLTLHFLVNNLLITAGLALALILFFYKKPVETVKFLGFCALLVTVLYVMSLLTESGTTGMSGSKILRKKSQEAILEQ